VSLELNHQVLSLYFKILFSAIIGGKGALLNVAWLRPFQLDGKALLHGAALSIQEYGKG